MTVTALPLEAPPAASAYRRFIARGLHWPVIIVCLLAIPVIAGGYLAYKATHDPTFAIESDYYRKAVAWDATMAQEQANAKLGWTAAATTQRAGDKLDVAVQLADKAGAVVPAATVHLDGFFLARSQEVQGADAVLGADGRYHALLALPHAGLHEVRMRASRGTDVFTAQWRLDVGH